MDREEMIQMYSDFHKDVYGFRPRFDYGSFSDEHLQADFYHFDKKILAFNLRDAVLEEEAIIDFKKSIQDTIECGASNEDEAIRWLVGAEITVNDVYSIQDIEQFVWKQGFLFTDYGRQLVKKIETFITQCMTVQGV
jgi:hypothetical protein